MSGTLENQQHEKLPQKHPTKFSKRAGKWREVNKLAPYVTRIHVNQTYIDKYNQS